MYTGGQAFEKNVPEEEAPVCVRIEGDNLNRLRAVRRVIKQQLDSLRISAEDREVDALRRRTCPGRESRTGPRGICFQGAHRLPGNTRPLVFDSHSFKRDSWKLDLKTTQCEIASNWIEVYQKYVGSSGIGLALTCVVLRSTYRFAGLIRATDLRPRSRSRGDREGPGIARGRSTPRISN